MISRFLLAAALLGLAGALAAEEKPAASAEQAPVANPPEAQQPPQAEQTPQVPADPYADFNKQVQEKLKAFGFYGGPVNGDFGPYTQAALAQFQLSVPLPASGMLDEATIAALGVEPAVAAAGEASASAGADQPPADVEKPLPDAAQPAQPRESVPTSAKPE